MSRRSKHISLGRIWLKPRCLGRASQNVSRLVEPVRKIEVRGRAERNISRLVKLSPNLEALVAPVKTYLAWSKHRCFGRADRNISRLVELGRNIEFWGRTGRNVSRLVELSRNLYVLVAPVETYLAWSN